MLVDISFIDVRPDRQRTDLGDLEELKQSILNLGLINPIVVENKEDGSGYWVIAGERRLRALQAIEAESGMFNHQVEVRLFDQLDESAKQLIELDENIKRKNLSWQEYVCALNKVWMLIGEGKMSQEACAKQIGLSKSTLNRALAIYENLEDERVKNATDFANAYNVVKRINDRKMANVMIETMDAIDEILDDGGNLRDGGEGNEGVLEGSNKTAGRDAGTNGSKTSTAGRTGIGSAKGQMDLEDFLGDTGSGVSNSVGNVQFAESPYRIIQGDFFKWADEYKGRPFDLIHCDFPYGIEHDRSAQGKTNTFGAYEDSEDIYKQLVEGLLANKDKIIAPSANVICWLSLRYARWTIDKFTEAGFTHLLQPFIWHKNDGKGIVADPACGMRNCCEYALIFIRNRRKVAKIISNIIAAPATKHFHASEKPRAVLDKLLSAFVDDSSRVLDPTCGSGTAIQAAWKNKAKEALGIEMDKGFATEAQKWLDETIKTEGAIDNLEIDLD